MNADVNGGLLNYFMFVTFLWKLFVPGLIDLLASMFRSFGFSGEIHGQTKQPIWMMEMVLVCTSISLMPCHLTTVRITGNETGVIHWDYGDPEFSTCKETIQWGNHRMACLLIGTFTESSVGKRYITSNLLADDNSACSGTAFMALSYKKVFLFFFNTFR